MDPFQQYASLYDLVNGGKNYAAEVEFVLQQLGLPPGGLVADLGCGTGGHALLLAERGLRVLGIDRSADMISRAEARRSSLDADARERVHFQVGSLQRFETPASLDAAVSLFHVVSYQIENGDLAQAFGTIRSRLKTGAHFLFDYWHGPGVLTDPPIRRERQLENEELRVRRIAEPETLTRRNRVIVRYTFEVQERRTGERTTFSEEHHMRYLFEPELELLLEAAGFRVVRTMSDASGEPPTTSSWTAWTLAEAV